MAQLRDRDLQSRLSAPAINGETLPSSDVTERTKRGHKSRPRELSSRRPVPVGRFRCLGLDDSINTGRSVRKFDPRFEAHCGELREEHVERNYDFVREMRQKQREKLEKTVERGKGGERTVEQLKQMQQEEKQRLSILQKRKLLKDIRATEKEAVKKGKTPYFLKERDVKQVQLRAKFESLKKGGGVQKFIEKRRKKLASKDKKLLPSRRTEE